MKKILLILTVITGTLILNACRKDDNPKLPDIMRVPVPLLQLTENSTLIIEDDDDKANFKSAFNVKLYFPDDAKPAKYDIVVAKNGDYSNVKVYAANLTELPGAVEITTPKLAELFGLTMDGLTRGMYFEVRASFTLANGTVVPAFSVGGEAYSTDLKNLPGSSLSLKYQIVCPLDINIFTGQLTVEDPGMWEGTYPVTVTLEAGNKLRVTGWFEDAANSFIMEYDPVNRTINIPYQVFRPGAYLFGYHDWGIEGKGEIDACNNTISFDFETTVAEGSFGTVTAKLHP